MEFYRTFLMTKTPEIQIGKVRSDCRCSFFDFKVQYLFLRGSERFLLTILDSPRGVLWTIVMAKIRGIKFATVTNDKIDVHFL